MPELSDSKKLELYLYEKHISFVSEIRENPVPPPDFYLVVPGIQVLNEVSDQATSDRQLKKYKEDIFRKLNIEIDWLISNTETMQQIEFALVELINRNLPDHFNADILVSWYRSSEIMVHITFPPFIAKNQLQLEEIITSFLALYKLPRPKIIITNSFQLPSDLQILRKIKTRSPIDTETISSCFRDEGYSAPGKYLQNTLDKLRKRNLVIRNPNNTYSLTAAGLEIVPHSFTRTSSDVERALDLGRKKW